MATTTAVHSNAFNFLSFVQSGVDARTGQYTISLSLPEVKTCELSGPVVPLTLNFNPLNTVNAGFGLGWEMGLTQYAPSNQIISLHSGETFKVTGPYPGFANRLRMKEQKIENFKLFTVPDTAQFKVVHKSGLVEVLELKGASPQVAVPIRLYSPQGHEVTLEYISVNGKPMLSAMRDNTGAVLQITRDTTAHTVTFSLGIVNGTPSARVVMNLKDDRVDRITLPTTEGAGWRFEYRTEKDLACISEVWTPLGAHETVRYNDEGHGFPGGDNSRKLPRVTDHITDPGSGDPPITVKYSYSADGHNFLGYGSSIDWDDSGLDNLFRVLDRYTYSSTERLTIGSETVRSITRTFNRFHLQTEEVVAQGNHQKTLRTRYYADDDDKLSFDNQPRQCQLPRQTSTLWALSDDPRFWRLDKEITEYDIHGNQTLRIEPTGLTETITYYPNDGVEGFCPADPYGFVRHVREKTVTPSSDPQRVPGLEPGASVKRARFRYETLPAISDSAIPQPWLCVVEERLYELIDETERQLSLTVFDYINDPATPLTHGRRARQAITLGDDSGPTSVIDYSYTKNPSNQSLRTVQQFSSDVDNAVRTVIDERSMLNGEPLLVTENGIQHRYVYDELNRVQREIQAPDSDYPATRRYSYRLIRPADAGQDPITTQAYQQMEDVKGVKVRTHFDGMSRAVREEMQDVDHSGGSYRDIYTAKYNAKGFLIEETNIDWLEATDLPLTTSYTYDLWGLQDSVTRPDGVKEWTLNNPIAFTTEEWIDGTARTRTITNRFEKTVSVEQIGVDGRRISQTSFKYDGLGNCTQAIDALGQITRYRYDAFARLLSTTLPDLSTVRYTYAEHSQAELHTSIEVEPGNTHLPTRRLGEQRFDGLDRLVGFKVGPRDEQLVYEAGHFQPKHRITPAGNQIDYQYKHGLSEKPTVVTAPDDESTFEVDLLDARLDSSKNSQGEYHFSYDEAGRLVAESWKDAVDNKTYTTRYKTSLKGRRLSRTDIGNHQTLMDYDRRNGRLLSIEQGQLHAAFDYDVIGRVYRTTSQDKATNNTLTTTLEFDELGRETLRTLVLLDAQNQPIEAERSIELTYLADSNVKTRHLRVGGASALLETYSYDLRGRLERYRCSGTDLPKDRYGNAIVSQYFEFDVLDNIIYTRTVFSDGRLDIAHFTFAEDDPCQLVGASHSHPDYQQLESRFSYDPDGNLEHDETGLRLRYDSQGRLVQVTTPTGQSVTAYRYDPHDNLQAVQPQGDTQTLRFYQGTRVTDTLHDDHHIQFLYHEGQPLGQQTPSDDGQTLLLLTDAKRSVIGENQGSDVRSVVYGAYGERDENNGLQSLLAFNGEAVESTGWYLLGNGYRAYNPSLMRFHSPDSMSPFGAGGLNCYMYCAGNPIAFSDPSGHRAQSLVNNYGFQGGLFGASIFIGIVLSILTANAAPLIAAVAEAVGTTTTMVVSTVNTVANIVTWGSMAAAAGTEAARMFVRDEQANETLGWIGAGLGLITMPKVKAVKTGSPQVRVHVPESISETTKTSVNWSETAKNHFNSTSKKTSLSEIESVGAFQTPPSKTKSGGAFQTPPSKAESGGAFQTRPSKTKSGGASLRERLLEDQRKATENVVAGGPQFFKFREAGMPHVIEGVHRSKPA
ncbi:RHS repeat-associated core domain-containing protein [Pseudomonas sp. SWRI179]|uniref:RHS repeat domain-containing protein n=1 Tax=Pseudomonas sp. SWRI179 TaxID=2745497 RepID=UPI001649416E|nr:RHS repeat-associated core domain-containing protein [Pseudomonas sp. SWRI179]MBC3383557.1 RHS repeat-associated core domain-containing protein [Pseudomonas sp. SWRI179]